MCTLDQNGSWPCQPGAVAGPWEGLGAYRTEMTQGRGRAWGIFLGVPTLSRGRWGAQRGFKLGVTPWERLRSGVPAGEDGAWAFRGLLCGDGSFVGCRAAAGSPARPGPPQTWGLPSACPRQPVPTYGGVRGWESRNFR